MFFDRPGTPPPVPDLPDTRPPWSGPPEDALPAALAWAFPLAVTDRVALALSGFRVWPTGFGFDLDVMLRTADRRGGPSRMLFRHPHPDDADDEGAYLRLGVRFADGRKAVEPAWPPHQPPTGDEPVLHGTSGGGGPRAAHKGYWVWPLPPAGPLTFACAWPRFDIPETLVEMDGNALVAASAHSRPLWTD